MEPASHINIVINRESSAPIGLQIKGQIEYAVACGDLLPGTRLPSVRNVAAALDVSPVTVSQAYGGLQREGLLSSHPGRGTFVTQGPGVRVDPDKNRFLEALMDRLAAAARDLGLSDEQLLQRLSAHLSRYAKNRSIRMMLVGLFEGATKAYAEFLCSLNLLAHVEWSTFERLKDSKERSRLSEFDLLVTFPSQLDDLQKLAPKEVPVTYLRFLPSEHTRILLAELDPYSRPLAVSTFPEFLPTLKSGIEKFAPHLRDVRFTILADSNLEALLRAHQVVVYATGSEQIRQLLPPGARAFEYRHTPDAAFVEEYLAPVLRKLRAGESIATIAEDNCEG